MKVKIWSRVGHECLTSKPSIILSGWKYLEGELFYWIQLCCIMLTKKCLFSFTFTKIINITQITLSEYSTIKLESNNKDHRNIFGNLETSLLSSFGVKDNIVRDIKKYFNWTIIKIYISKLIEYSQSSTFR